MKNKYILLLPFLLFISTAAIFLTSKPVTDVPLDIENCNCSGPKASKLETDSS
tara:strand:+ start:310 stop:468 length:159 start_codon:yes stop_codon:yes gene_type:complete